MKRVFDITFSGIALLVFFLPALVIIIIIKIFYRHPILFRQERIGKNKKLFCILKFQTLINEQPTALGRILRKTGLDEIAQFINVFKGEMSIIGPRALTMADIKRLGWDTDYYSFRWSVKPGISGYAQLYGGQHKRISLFWDRKYVGKNNLSLDFCIIFISFLMNIFGKKRIRRLIWTGKNLK
jgi:lipopolysaccharide/colanic/teichoic acid biosynthesis glycosyltransferase